MFISVEVELSRGGHRPGISTTQKIHLGGTQVHGWPKKPSENKNAKKGLEMCIKDLGLA